jgi:hypothetical protein
MGSRFNNVATYIILTCNPDSALGGSIALDCCVYGAGQRSLNAPFKCSCSTSNCKLAWP